jgi:hypothetical protein
VARIVTPSNTDSPLQGEHFMNTEPNRTSMAGRFVVVAAAVALVSTGWLSLQHQAGPVVSYSTVPDAAPVSFEDGDAQEPAICQPQRGRDSACTYEAGI